MSDTESNPPFSIGRVFSKSISVVISEAEGLCNADRILRFAQNDRHHDSNFEKALFQRRFRR